MYRFTLSFRSPRLRRKDRTASPYKGDKESRDESRDRLTSQPPTESRSSFLQWTEIFFFFFFLTRSHEFFLLFFFLSLSFSLSGEREENVNWRCQLMKRYFQTWWKFLCIICVLRVLYFIYFYELCMNNSRSFIKSFRRFRYVSAFLGLVLTFNLNNVMYNTYFNLSAQLSAV